MVNVPVLAGREFRSYFVSPIAYIVLTVFTLVQGITFSLVFAGDRVSAVDLNQVFQSTVGTCSFLMLFAAPLITMGLIAEESSKGTIESLFSAPVTDGEVVLGKYLAALLFAVVLFLPTLFNVLMMEVVGKPDYGPILSGYMGIFLMSAQFLAIGIFCSSLTRSQVGAGIISVAILMSLWIAGYLFGEPTNPVAKFALRLSPFDHLSGFVNGVIDTRDVVYYVTTSVLFLFFTLRVVESRKWR